MFERQRASSKLPFSRQTIAPSQEDPFESSPIRCPSPPLINTINTLTKATADAFEEARHLSLKRESIANEYSRALDEVINHLNESTMRAEASILTIKLAKVLKRFVLGDMPIVDHNSVQKEQTAESNSQYFQDWTSVTFAQVTKSEGKTQTNRSTA
jgi:hypothetical protein